MLTFSSLPLVLMGASSLFWLIMVLRSPFLVLKADREQAELIALIQHFKAVDNHDWLFDDGQGF